MYLIMKSDINNFLNLKNKLYGFTDLNNHLMILQAFLLQTQGYKVICSKNNPWFYSNSLGDYLILDLFARSVINSTGLYFLGHLKYFCEGDVYEVSIKSPNINLTTQIVILERNTQIALPNRITFPCEITFKVIKFGGTNLLSYQQSLCQDHDVEARTIIKDSEVILSLPPVLKNNVFLRTIHNNSLTSDNLLFYFSIFLRQYSLLQKNYYRVYNFIQYDQVPTFLFNNHDFRIQNDQFGYKEKILIIKHKFSQIIQFFKFSLPFSK